MQLNKFLDEYFSDKFYVTFFLYFPFQKTKKKQNKIK